MFRDVPPIESIDDLAAPGVFDTDGELDVFLAFVRANHDANLARESATRLGAASWGAT